MPASNIVERWERLCCDLEISGGAKSLCENKDLIDLEQELGCLLPSGYKEYCNRLGSGVIAGTLRIYCPCSFATLADVRRYPYAMENLRENVESSIDGQRPWDKIDSDKLKLLQRLCKHGFNFGGTDGDADIVLWDLSSKGPEDDDYDIYWIDTERLNNTFLIGRDFFEFIRGFIIGDESNERSRLADIGFFANGYVKNTFLRFGEEMTLDKSRLQAEAEAAAIMSEIRSGTFLPSANAAEKAGDVLKALSIYIKADYAIQKASYKQSELQLFQDVQAAIGRLFKKVDYDQARRLWFDIWKVELPLMMWMFYKSLDS